jgi:hypothetical protein
MGLKCHPPKKEEKFAKSQRLGQSVDCGNSSRRHTIRHTSQSKIDSCKSTEQIPIFQHEVLRTYSQEVNIYEATVQLLSRVLLISVLHNNLHKINTSTCYTLLATCFVRPFATIIRPISHNVCHPCAYSIDTQRDGVDKIYCHVIYRCAEAISAKSQNGTHQSELSD